MERNYTEQVHYRGYDLAKWDYTGHVTGSAPTNPFPRRDVLDQDDNLLRIFSNRVHAEAYVDHLHASG